MRLLRPLMALRVFASIDSPSWAAMRNARSSRSGSSSRLPSTSARMTPSARSFQPLARVEEAPSRDGRRQVVDELEGHGVHREVATREVLQDGLALESGDVDLLEGLAARRDQDQTVDRVLLVERHERAPGTRASRAASARVRAGEVEVAQGAAEGRVADGAADEPHRLPRNGEDPREQPRAASAPRRTRRAAIRLLAAAPRALFSARARAARA